MIESERRACSRRLQRYLVHLEDEGDSRFAFTHDVSSAGVFLRTRYPPPPGAGVRLLIRTPGGAEAHTGVVVWARLNLAGPRNTRRFSGAGIKLNLVAQEQISDIP